MTFRLVATTKTVGRGSRRTAVELRLEPVGRSVLAEPGKQQSPNGFTARRDGLALPTKTLNSTAVDSRRALTKSPRLKETQPTVDQPAISDCQSTVFSSFESPGKIRAQQELRPTVWKRNRRELRAILIDCKSALLDCEIPSHVGGCGSWPHCVSRKCGGTR